MATTSQLLTKIQTESRNNVPPGVPWTAIEAAVELLLTAVATGVSGSATAAKQDTGNASLSSIDGKVATQTTLAALLAKVIAAPATETKQDTGNTSLASILSKLNVGVAVAPFAYDSNTVLSVADGTIPIGAFSWSILAVSGTVTVNGVALAVGSGVSGGGYSGATLGTAVPYTITAGSALVAYDILSA